MNAITQREHDLVARRAELDEARIQLRTVPEVLRDAVVALRSGDTSAFEMVIERILLGAGATSFAQGAGADRQLVELRSDVLRTRTASFEPDQVGATAVLGTFVARVRGYLAPLIVLFEQVDTLEETVRAGEAAINIALAVLAARSLHDGEVVTGKDLGWEFGVEPFFTALAAECAWSRETNVVRSNLSVQLAALAAVADERQLPWSVHTPWEDWVYDAFEVAAARGAPWASHLARRLRPHPTPIDALLTQVFSAEHSARPGLRRGESRVRNKRLGER
jgi:hypothetical protein